jgi:hypothetical protein
MTNGLVEALQAAREGGDRMFELMLLAQLANLYEHRRHAPRDEEVSLLLYQHDR